MIFRKKEIINTGFGSNINNEGDRLIDKNGKFNVKKNGLSFFHKFNLFHTMISMPTILFFCFLLLGFLFINLVFTSIYLLIGLDGLQGVTSDHDFFNAFYFSSQTLTTVGYGALHPTGKIISLVASVEAFTGLLSFAVATGLIYGRFSKPKKKLIFSKNALISPYKDITGLMVRVANPTSSQLINVEAKMMFSQFEKSDNNISRKFYTLDLEMDKISLFVTSWTLVHPITDKSPLFNLNHQDLIKNNAELILLMRAYDESHNQETHSRTSYKHSEMIEGVKFISVLDKNEELRPTIQLDKLNDYE